jgi:hypothetical protein
MSTAQRDAGIDFTDIPRVVLSIAAAAVHTVERAVVGDARVRRIVSALAPTRIDTPEREPVS